MTIYIISAPFTVLFEQVEETDRLKREEEERRLLEEERKRKELERKRQREEEVYIGKNY